MSTQLQAGGFKETRRQIVKSASCTVLSSPAKVNKTKSLSKDSYYFSNMNFSNPYLTNQMLKSVKKVKPMKILGSKSSLRESLDTQYITEIRQAPFFIELTENL